MKRLVTAFALSLVALAAAAAEPTETQVDAACRKANPDKDGTLDLAEYLEALTR